VGAPAAKPLSFRRRRWSWSNRCTLPPAAALARRSGARHAPSSEAQPAVPFRATVVARLRATPRPRIQWYAPGASMLNPGVSFGTSARRAARRAPEPFSSAARSSSKMCSPTMSLRPIGRSRSRWVSECTINPIDFERRGICRSSVDALFEFP